jgi:hypothetical protein
MQHGMALLTTGAEGAGIYSFGIHGRDRAQVGGSNFMDAGSGRRHK